MVTKKTVRENLLQKKSDYILPSAHKTLPRVLHMTQRLVASSSRKCRINQAQSNAEGSLVSKVHQNRWMGMTSILMIQSLNMKQLLQTSSHP